MLKDKKIIITGGLGFLGYAIFNKLKQTNKLLIIDNFSTNTHNRNDINKHHNSKFIDIDINSKTISKTFEDFKPDIVIHCAAQTSVIDSIKNPSNTKRINIEGTKNILNGIKSLKKCFFVFISSGGAIYGNPIYLPVDEKHKINPISTYGISKNEGEIITKKILDYHKIDYSIIRPSNIYGPNQKSDNVIPKFIDLMKKNKKIDIFGNGSSSRDYIFIDDLVNIINIICKKKIKCVVNASTNEEIKIIEIFRILSKYLEYSQSPKFLDFREGEINKIYLDNTKIKEITGIKKFIGIDEGLMKTILF
tara:strand:+ start:1760 stop:2677 length:918 start_codon:yes stop_codon:yes gene_type:complete